MSNCSLFSAISLSTRVTISEIWSALLTTGPLETAGVLTGIACVWLAARNSLWNFPTAIVSCGLYVYIFGSSRLYSDMGLQFVFIALAGYGWYAWLHPADAGAPALPVTRTGGRLALLLLLGVGLYALGAGFLFRHYTNAALPYWDTTTTAVSIAAQVLLARKKLENWLIWVAVDVVYVGMYWHKQLYLTSVLYLIYLGLAIYGYLAWRRLMRREQPVTSSGPAAVMK